MPPQRRVPPLIRALRDKLNDLPPPPSAGKPPPPGLHRPKAITDIEDSLAAAEGRMRTFVECGLAYADEEVSMREYVDEIHDILNQIEGRLPKL